MLDKLIYLDKYPDLDTSMSDSNIGARKNKNVRNHLFTVYGVINSVINGGQGCIDIQIYDLIKAFDALWLEDCLNDIYDALPEKKRDDKLALLYQTNVNNLVAVNTAVGQTERVNMERIVQQGGSWGPMECSVSIDKIGKLCTERGEHIFKYNNLGNIVPLAMVDDLLGVASCGFKSLSLNTFMNTQIEMKRLKFHTPDANGKTKCHRLHVGKQNENCPQFLVHGTPMKTVFSDVYLGDEISADGSNKLNIQRRVKKGNGIVSQLMTLLQKTSLGKHYFRIALLLRDSIFLSSILTNSEVWYGLTASDIEELESLDRTLLRMFYKVPSSTPVAGLYLESGSLRIGTLVKARRINYLHYLLKQPKSDMLAKFFYAQWSHSSKLDWTEQLKVDLFDFDLPRDLETLEKQSVNSFKNLIKKKAKEYEYRCLMRMKTEKSKVKMKNLEYEKLQLQPYLNELDSNLASCVLRFRLRMAPFSENFKGQGPLKLCPLCGFHLDTQAMSFQCSEIRKKVKISIKYETIFKPEVPLETAKILQEILKIRENHQN